MDGNNVSLVDEMTGLSVTNDLNPIFGPGHFDFHPSAVFCYQLRNCPYTTDYGVYKHDVNWQHGGQSLSFSFYMADVLSYDSSYEDHFSLTGGTIESIAIGDFASDRVRVDLIYKPTGASASHAFSFNLVTSRFDMNVDLQEFTCDVNCSTDSELSIGLDDYDPRTCVYECTDGQEISFNEEMQMALKNRTRPLSHALCVYNRKPSRGRVTSKKTTHTTKATKKRPATRTTKKRPRR